jgi:hypothetical protein
VQGAPGAIDERFARGRQFHGARGPQKQRASDFFFQAADLLGKRRLRHMETLRRMAEMQFLRDSEKVTEVAEIDILIHMRIVLMSINNILDVLIGFV